MLVKLAKSRAGDVESATKAAMAAGRKYIDCIDGKPDGERMSMVETVSRQMKIVNDKGLHARASAKFVEVVEEHDAEARVGKDGMETDGDSIMGLLMLAASCGTQIDVETSGRDAQKLMDALEALVADKFGEELL